jgi:putative restriction endonuclease
LLNPEILVYYSTKFARLRVDRAHGIAPHKPILLLSVIELIKQGLISQNQIYLSEELITTFKTGWSYLGSENHYPDISRPFFHLRGDKFWHLIPNRGYRKIITSKVKLKTFTEVKQAVKYAHVDDALFELLQDPLLRASLTTILVQKWFSSKLNQYRQYLETTALEGNQEPSGQNTGQHRLNEKRPELLHQTVYATSD